MINIQFQYTPKNLQTAYELHLKKFSLFQGRVMMLFGFMIIWAGLLLMMIYHKQGILLPHVIFILLGILVIAFHFVYIKTIGKRMYNSLTEFHDPYNIEITNEGIQLFLSESQPKYLWQQFKKAVITDTVTLVYFNDKAFYFFMAADFANNDYKSFTDLVRSEIQIIKN